MALLAGKCEEIAEMLDGLDDISSIRKTAIQNTLLSHGKIEINDKT